MPVPVAAIDVGSNSVRIAVMSISDHGVLDVIEEARSVPRLIRDIEQFGAFRPATIDHLLSVLGDFRLIAHAAGAEVIAVATSAARDAANGDELVQRIHDELGIDLRVISGDEEAHLAFLGATYSLPVSDGIVIDVGGGSMEVVRFHDRQSVQTWTLPLGAVRLTDRFLQSDPLVTAELRAMRAHIAAQLEAAHIPPLEDGATLVGTGGTIRNLGKIERARRSYPLSRLHGYEVPRPDLRRVADLIQSRSLSERRAISGLNEERADTIVAGALVVDAMMTELHAPSLMVSGQGLREGMALHSGARALPTLTALRAAAARDAVTRFVPDRRELAECRLSIVEALATAVEFAPDPAFVETLAAAAIVLDIGRCVDYYNRERHTESLLLERGLDGWSHRDLALICAIVRQGHQEKYTPSSYRPLIAGRDHEVVAGAGCLLALAEAIAIRRSADDSRGLVWRREEQRLFIADEALGRWEPGTLGERLQRAFGIELHIEGRPSPH